MNGFKTRNTFLVVLWMENGGEECYNYFRNHKKALAKKPAQKIIDLLNSFGCMDEIDPDDVDMDEFHYHLMEL